MKIIKQKKGTHIYAYKEESAYWDKQKQQCRKKLTYLGKVDQGTGEIIPKKPGKALLPKSIYNFGGSFLCQEIAKKIKLQNILESIFGEQRTTDLLLVAIFKIITSDPMYLFSDWIDTVVLESDLTSQRISEFLKQLSKESSLIDEFFSSWTNLNKSRQAVMFDITSISSYSNNIDIVESGYNRDGESLEQINLGLISSDLPLAYRIYPGSINDVVTLKMQLKLFKSLSLKIEYLVMDKGFYSYKNLEELDKTNYNYIIPASFSVNLFKKLIEQHSAELERVDSSFAFQEKDNIHYLHKKVKLKSLNINAHIFLDPLKRVLSANAFLNKLNVFEEHFHEYKFVDIEEVRTFISQSVGEHSYYLIEEDEQGFSITRDNKAVSKTLKRFGVFILLSNQEMDKNQILKLYREKDSVEKIFDTLKNSLKEKRLRVHSEDTLNGKMFVLFISLIIYTYMINQVKKNKTISKYSIPQVFKELDKIRLIILTDGTKHFSELSKKQKDILKAFDLKIPNSL